MNTNVPDLIIVVAIIATAYTFLYMYKMLKYTKRIRIMQSMQLQILQQIAKEQGVSINLEKIAEEVEKSVK